MVLGCGGDALRLQWLFRSLLAWIFRFFPKQRKCSRLYAFQLETCFRAFKKHKFSHRSFIIFHVFFCFPNPLPETIFRGSKCQPIRKSAVLDRFPIFLGSHKRPLEHHCQPQSRQKCATPNYRQRPFSKVRFSMSFWSHVDPLLAPFGFLLAPFG